jgi:drug/metabolite transporter (DMT)-like permease
MATILLCLVTRTPALPSDVPTAAWPGLAGIGIFAAAIAIQAFYASAARIGAAQASLMATVEPIVVILLGVTFLNEAFSPIRGIGAAIVMAGVLLAQFATPAEARPIILEEP